MRPWMFRVARDLVIDVHRARTTRPPETGGATWLTALGSESDDIERMPSSLVDDALETPSPAHRDAPRTAFLVDRTTRQAAVALGVPHGAVKSRVYYAPRSLKAALPERGAR